jgi:hypothetical protein
MKKITYFFLIMISLIFFFEGQQYPLGTLSNPGYGAFPQYVIILFFIMCLTQLLRND